MRILLTCLSLLILILASLSCTKSGTHNRVKTIDTASIIGTWTWAYQSSNLWDTPRKSFISPAPAPALTPANTGINRILIFDSTGRFTEALAGPDGRFTVASLAPGEYRLLAFTRRQTLEYENPEAMRAYDGKGLVVRVSGGQKEQVQLHLIPAGE